MNKNKHRSYISLSREMSSILTEWIVRHSDDPALDVSLERINTRLCLEAYDVCILTSQNTSSMDYTDWVQKIYIQCQRWDTWLHVQMLASLESTSSAGHSIASTSETFCLPSLLFICCHCLRSLIPKIYHTRGSRSRFHPKPPPVLFLLSFTGYNKALTSNGGNENISTQFFLLL